MHYMQNLELGESFDHKKDDEKQQRLRFLRPENQVRELLPNAISLIY